MRVNNTVRKIIDCFLRKHCRDSPCQTFFWKEFRYVYEENRTVIHRPRSVGIGKNYALSRLRALFFPIPTDLGGRITYICVPEIELKATGHVKYMYIDLLAFLIGKLRYKGSQSHYPDIYDL